MATAAFSAKTQPTDDWDILPWADFMPAVRTMARRRDKRFATRHAPYDHIQKTADDGKGDDIDQIELPYVHGLDPMHPDQENGRGRIQCRWK